jgi:hypothetical protein
MPLPAGTWRANVNGVENPLTISAPDAQGVLRGEFTGVEFKGFWDEGSQTIAFSITISFENAIPSVALFKGYLFRTPANPSPGQDVIATLSGYVQITIGTVPSQPFPILPTARRNVFGWVAHITEVL